MPDQDTEHYVAMAADLFVRLREDPEDPDLLARRDAFLQSGAEARRIYARVEQAWGSTGPGTPGPAPACVPSGRRRGILGVALFLLLACGWFAQEPVARWMLADFSTRQRIDRIRLASGDRAVLDAGTALADHTTGAHRGVKLLDGAAVFDVTPGDRTFVVLAGDLRIEVLGTTFETAHLDDLVTVAVSQGRVRVSAPGARWTLERGDRLIRDGAGRVRVMRVDPAGIAAWRTDRLQAEGLTLAQVVGVLDRRLARPVTILGADLARTRVSGTIDLARPERALEAISVALGARILSVPMLGYIILR